MTGIMLRPEINEALSALGATLAGEHDGDIAAAERAQKALWDVPKGGAMVAFSAKEMELLWIAIENGAEGVLQTSSGFRSGDRKAFKAAANRIAEAGKIEGPRF